MEMEGKQGAPRVLVVEDDFLIAMQTEVALTTAGFEVVGPAATAEEAVALAREAQPTLAVMDIRLASARDGIDAARQLYQDFAIRCIFATAHDDAHTRGRAEPYCRSRTPWPRSSRWSPKLWRGCAGHDGQHRAAGGRAISTDGVTTLAPVSRLIVSSPDLNIEIPAG